MEKKRFKMYKKGKSWVVAPIVFLGLLGIIGVSTETALADEIPSIALTETVVLNESVNTEVPATEPVNDISDANSATSDIPEKTEIPENAETNNNEGTNEGTIDLPLENSDNSDANHSEQPTEEGNTIPDDLANTEEESGKSEQTNELNPSEEESQDKETSTDSAKQDEKIVEEAVASTASSLEKDTAAKAAPIVNTPVYRIYNPGNGEHFYTTNLQEKDWLVSIGWGIYEGVAFQSPSEGKVVYRLYNYGLRDHHYTMSWDEVSWLTKNYGWTYEGVSWNSSDANGKKVYRLFTPNQTTGTHLFTMNWDEVSWLTANHGWIYEGVGFYSAGDSSGAVTSRVLNVPYVSQYTPVNSPWGCAGAAMAMLLRYKGVNVDLKYVQDNLPMYPNDAGGQQGNVYTGAGFGWVITPQSLTNYAKRWYSNVSNITGSNTQALINRILGGNPILYYGFSSYQKQNDNVRNHCKVIVGYRDNQFLIHDPLYYRSTDGAGSGGGNMAYDRGAVAWVSVNDFNKEWDGRALGIS
ncbi:C39 family peptidase [Enterococcus sp. AZ109]|uniref:C39 family peptidase n=1 Tax=Enterococcus sp. AZ109 TaxID=2774634 RepID=UPI003F28A5E0